MATNITPLINGKSYEFADITLFILGSAIIGVTAIEYSEDADIKNVYSTGRYPTSRTHGLVDPKAKITFLLEEVNNILAIAPNGRLHDIPEFDVIVTFTDASLIPVVHKIRNCRFKNNSVSSESGGSAIPVPLELVPSHIEWN